MNNKIKRCIEISNKYRQLKVDELSENYKQLYLENLGLIGKIFIQQKQKKYENAVKALEHKYLIDENEIIPEFNDLEELWNSFGLFSESLEIKNKIYFHFGFSKKEKAECLLEWYDVFLGPDNYVYKFYLNDLKNTEQTKRMASAKGIQLYFQPLHDVLLEKYNLPLSKTIVES
jgi:hypothetical protein